MAAAIAEERALLRRQLWADLDQRARCFAMGDVAGAGAYSQAVSCHHETLRQLCCAEMELMQSEIDCCNVNLICHAIGLRSQLLLTRAPMRDCRS